VFPHQLNRDCKKGVKFDPKVLFAAQKSGVKVFDEHI